MVLKRIGVALMLAVSLPAAAMAEPLSFDRLDTDKSNSISRTEFLKGDMVLVTAPDGSKRVGQRNPAIAGQTAVTEQEKHRLFDSIDRDRNGFISRKEWQRASPDGFILWRF